MMEVPPIFRPANAAAVSSISSSPTVIVPSEYLLRYHFGVLDKELCQIRNNLDVYIYIVTRPVSGVARQTKLPGGYL